MNGKYSFECRKYDPILVSINYKKYDVIFWFKNHLFYAISRLTEGN